MSEQCGGEQGAGLQAAASKTRMQSEVLPNKSGEELPSTFYWKRVPAGLSVHLRK